MAEMAGGGVSQRAAAMAAFNQKTAKREEEKEFTPSSQLSAREKAMQNLNKKGVVSSREARGASGSSQHGAALASLGIKDEAPTKVVPNWKLTAAQKNAAAARAEIKGSSNHLEAAARFGLEKKGTTGSLPTSFVPVSKTPGAPDRRVSAGNINNLTPRGAAVSMPACMPSAPPAAPQRRDSVGNHTAEAAEGVEKDLALLISAFPRLGTKAADGSISTTFAKVVDDEQLEQQLESLVGTLKAGRKRGVLQWEGQMLLKGPHDNVPITYVGEVKPKAAEPTPPPAAPQAPEPPAAESTPAAEEPNPETPAAEEEAKPEPDKKGEEKGEEKGEDKPTEQAEEKAQEIS